MWWWILVACGRGAGRIEEIPVSPHVGAGWAVGVPVGTRVTVEPDVVRADASDGTMWFDVRWTDDPPVQATALAWGRLTCTPPVWDEGWGDAHRWTVGGFCVIGNRRYWMVHLFEAIDNRTLHTAFLASARLVAYEDAWVLATRTALGFAGGNQPLMPPDPASVRARVRDAAAQPPGSMPVPGGGLLSTRVLPTLTEVWAARDTAPPPPVFGP